MNERLEILREELCDLHRENEELKDEDIEEILIDELGEKLGTRVYNRIFGLD